MTGEAVRRGLAAARAGQSAEAAQWFARAVEETPNDPATRSWLGQALCAAGRILEGAGHLRQAADGWLDGPPAPDRLDRALDVVGQLQHQGDFQGALALSRRAVSLYPRHARPWQLLAVTCGQINLTEEALAAGQAALALAPDHAMMAVLQASLEADAGRMEAARRRLTGLLAAALPDREAFRARKELARVTDGLGLYAEVFPHLEAAAAIAGRLPEWRSQDLELIPRLIRANQDAYSRESLGRWAGQAFPGPHLTHVFVVGYFRSGTTLIQQVLAGHPDVFVADEANLVWAAQAELNRLDPSTASTADKLARLDAAGVARLRDAYWTAARGRYGAAMDRPVFVDKFTLNTLDLGVINTIFPEARVVFALRDPRDVCLSAHLQLMTPSPATAHLLTWRGAAQIYARTLEWWRRIQPRLTLPVHVLRYEDAIGDFDGAFGALFTDLGLAWDPAVRTFHTRAQGAFVASPSRNQVSRPLYASSVARWRRYAAPMAAVDDLLGPVVRHFGYPPA